MKKNIIVIVITFLFIFIIGCEKQPSNNLLQYLEQLEIENSVDNDFYLPRVLNGEKDHVITWQSLNEDIIKISNIVSITGLEYYYVKVTKQDKECYVKLIAVIDMIDGTNEIKEFNVLVKEDATLREQKTGYIREIIEEFNGISIKESINLPTKTEEYNFDIVWKSSNEDVISSSGEYKAPDQDITIMFTVKVLENDSVFYETNIYIKAINKDSAEKEISLDFVTNFSNYASLWDSTYTERKLNQNDLGVAINCGIIFSRADKQASGNAISDRPVIATKGSMEYITIILDDNTINDIEIELMQWNTKTFDSIYLEYYDGSNWVKCSEETKTPGIITLSTDISEKNVSKVRVCIYSTTSKNVQLGLSKIQLKIN